MLGCEGRGGGARGCAFEVAGSGAGLESVAESWSVVAAAEAVSINLSQCVYECERGGREAVTTTGSCPCQWQRMKTAPAATTTREQQQAKRVITEKGVTDTV